MPRLIGNRRAKQRGVALLMVLLLLALMGSVVADFQYNSHVQLQLAINARDELQAEYNALSALKLRVMLLKNAAKLKNSISAIAGVNLSDMGLPIDQIIEQLPVECSMMSMVMKEAGAEAGELGVGDAETAGDFFPGECIATATNEDAKLPLGALKIRPGQGDEAAQAGVAMALITVLSAPITERHFQEDDRNGVHAESPLELVEAIADWVDADENRAFNNVSDEDRHYAYLEPSYEPKNAYFDSLAELQMVHGIDDEMYELLREHVSIYPDSNKVSIESMSAEKIGLLLISMLDLNAGVDFNQASILIATVLREIELLRMMGMAGAGAVNRQAVQSIVKSVGLDAYLRRDWINLIQPRGRKDWYSIEAQGRVGNASRKIRTVIKLVGADANSFKYARIE